MRANRWRTSHMRTPRLAEYLTCHEVGSANQTMSHTSNTLAGVSMSIPAHVISLLHSNPQKRTCTDIKQSSIVRLQEAIPESQVRFPLVHPCSCSTMRYTAV